jgi:hypothetical protein|tara:strand:+ start:6818 stop:7009 length:192 start_codon:yes stop_codon:yes gene_type:complete
MQKIGLNIQTKLTQELLKLLSELEEVDRDRMSNDGQLILDKIWKLLGQPTYEQNQKILEQKSK